MGETTRRVKPEPARVVRAVTLPVECPVDETRDNLDDALREAWRLSTDLANWAQRELALRDVRR